MYLLILCIIACYNRDMLKDPNRDWYTIKEAAEKMRVSRTVVYRLLKAGTLTAERNPIYDGRGPVRIAKEQLHAFLARPSR